LFLYAVVLGFGYGITYMLPIKNAWLFYPKRKGLVSGCILASKSMGSIAWSLLATFLANPNNLSPDLIIDIGNNQKEKLFSADSEVVANVPRMLCNLLIFIS
jgi:hypothetical protein